MKGQKILKPYKHFGGYNFLKFIFAEGASDVEKNYNLFQSYLKRTYDRKEIEGKTLGMSLGFLGEEDLLFIDDSTVYSNYIFPIDRTDAICRLYDLEEYIKGEQLGLSIEITGKPFFNNRYKNNDYIGFTIHDTTIPKFKRTFLNFYRNIHLYLNIILPYKYHVCKYTKRYLGKYYFIIGFARTIFWENGIEKYSITKSIKISARKSHKKKD